jgi:hypothetical protein
VSALARRSGEPLRYTLTAPWSCGGELAMHVAEINERASDQRRLDGFQQAFDLDFRVLLAAINPAVLLGLRSVSTS